MHANSPRDALSRVETLCLMSDVALPLSALRRQMASAIQLIVQVARLKDGSRRVLAITEVTGLEGETVLTQDIFLFQQQGEDAKGRIQGALKPTGIAPEFLKKAKADGYAVDFSLFTVKK